MRPPANLGIRLFVVVSVAAVIFLLWVSGNLLAEPSGETGADADSRFLIFNEIDSKPPQLRQTIPAVRSSILQRPRAFLSIISIMDPLRGDGVRLLRAL
jgi:hypothetical protein